MEKYPMTLEGAEWLKAELKRLKSEVRPRIVAAIEEARAHGDLSENAEYHAAKEQQSFNEGRIKELENKIAMAEVIDTRRIRSTRVVFGARVTLVAEDSDERVTHQIVGEDEADLEKGKISIVSPVARALIGKEEGDIVEVRAPGGVRRYEILEIGYS
ncbi:MAG: transcription elongation factor GreA [Magnetococcales bacterium]|nr:transcription elongation factor GreA [Magnetococcales bacterium]